MIWTSTRYRHPRFLDMKNTTSLSHEESFICCDSEIDNTTDFLNETYDKANIKSNAYGAIHVPICVLPGTGFIHPNYIEDSSIGNRPHLKVSHVISFH